VICGGESGPKARPMHPDWARSLREQCVAAEIPFFFKQWGKKAAGRLLDGTEWSQFPETGSAGNGVPAACGGVREGVEGDT
jgi:protein gp37